MVETMKEENKIHPDFNGILIKLTYRTCKVLIKLQWMSHSMHIDFRTLQILLKKLKVHCFRAKILLY